MSSKSKVYFFFDGVTAPLKNRNELKRFIEKMIHKAGRKLTGLNYIFCSDETLKDINRKYLDHNSYTDIISFDLSPDPSTLNGEIYISVDRVRENSTVHHVTLSNELLRVIFHGALHLTGFRDKTSLEQQEMRKAEDDCLAKFSQKISRKTVSG